MEVPASTSEPATAASTLNNLALETSWLSQAYEVQSDSSDREMAKLIALACISDAMYSIRSVYRLE